MKEQRTYYVCLRNKDWLNYNYELKTHCEKWENISNYEQCSSFYRQFEDRIITEKETVIDISIDTSLKLKRKYRKILHDFHVAFRDAFDPNWKLPLEGAQI